ncbi:MAG: winged helix-turn-helix transcriptional regulator [Chloroflexi bacterium]|nr:winged helix-turn-helix transcriptional regulator [Chloroflexota bacterium]MDA1147179.1 winged helix-turn-helix transcriptional regulator [Chloroflexota bacterium]
MKSYGQYCPIAKGSEVLGERWSMLVVRELLIGSHRFNDIARGLPDMSRTLLSKRLRQFEEVGLLERVHGEYYLTPAGEGLRSIVFGLGDWTARWLLADPEPEELDSEKAMWWGHSRINTAALPDTRVVIQFRFSDDPRVYWIVAEPEIGASICLSDPGFEVDVIVRSDVATLSALWQGRGSVQAAVRAGRMTFEGPRALTRRMPEVLTITHPSVMGESASTPRPRMFVPS